MPIHVMPFLAFPLIVTLHGAHVSAHALLWFCALLGGCAFHFMAPCACPLMSCQGLALISSALSLQLSKLTLAQAQARTPTGAHNQHGQVLVEDQLTSFATAVQHDLLQFQGRHSTPAIGA